MILGRVNLMPILTGRPFRSFWITFHDCPEGTPKASNEIKYPNYKRQQAIRKAGPDCAWHVDLATGVASNIIDLTFPIIHKRRFVRATHVAGWTQKTGGLLGLWLQLEDSPIVFQLGDRPMIQKGQMRIAKISSRETGKALPQN